MTTQFCRFLEAEGYERTTEQVGCFTILEYQSNLEKNDAALGGRSFDQVAVCLVPAAQADGAITTSKGRVVYAAPPFFTSKLRLTIQEADKAASALLHNLLKEFYGEPWEDRRARDNAIVVALDIESERSLAEVGGRRGRGLGNEPLAPV